MSASDLLPAAQAGTIRIAGFDVPRMGFGAMRLRSNIQDNDRLLDRAIELGIRFFDTAEFYMGANAAISRALYPYRDDVLIATKAGPVMSRRGIVGEADAAGIEQSVVDNLRHLRLETLDLVHARKMPGLSFELLVETLIKLKERGLIRHIGISNVTLADFELAQSMTEVASVQNPYSILNPRDTDVLAAAERDSIPYLPYFPLGAGGSAQPPQWLAHDAKVLRATPSQYALAWLLDRSPIVLPIPGTGNIEHLEENVAAGRIAQDLRK